MTFKAHSFRPFLAFFLLLVLLILPSCDRGTAPTFPGAPIVLISIDTLRSDRLPAYGYDGIETPVIDALAADSIVYERAWSHYPITVPSHASMLTGLLPTEHGVRDNVGYLLDSENLPYLPRWLAERGYVNGAAVSTYLLRADTGLGEGFDFYEDSFSLRRGVSLGENQRSGFETTRRAAAWLEEVAPGGDPFFLFLHLYDPHTPYDPPEPWASRYADPYDGEVAKSDAIVGELIDALKRLGIYDEAIIVLLSDHGEGLGDHGEMEHGILLYREALQIPLLLKLPGGELGGTRAVATAQLIDVMPTLQALVGGEEIEATTLLDLVGEEAPERLVYAETWYPRLHLGWSELTSLVDEELHYIDGPDPEIYDWIADPGETENILTQRRGELIELRATMEEYRTELAAPGAVDAETAERLAALGYLSSSVAPSDGPLPDPKSQLHVLDDLMAASRAQLGRDWSTAVTLFRRVLEANPNLVDAWENLAQCLHHLGRFEEAEEAYRQALEKSRGADHVALGLARLYLELGDFQAARGHAALALPTNPAAARLTLARVALGEGDMESAAAEARRALDARANAVGPLLVLALAAIESSDLAAAGEHVAAADRLVARLGEGETPPGLYFVKGDLAARQGDGAAARENFLAEIRLHPDDPRPYGGLAILFALAGQPQEAVGMVRQLVNANPTPTGYAAAVDMLRTLGDPAAAERLRQHALGLFPGNPKLVALAP